VLDELRLAVEEEDTRPGDALTDRRLGISSEVDA
jgi:hypothetical protein